MQDAAYETLLRSKRPGLHAQIADALEKEFPQLCGQQAGVAGPSPHRGGRSDGRDPAVAQGWGVRPGTGRPAGSRCLPAKGAGHRRATSTSADRDSLELSLREPLHSARLQWRGWASPEVGDNAEGHPRVGQQLHRTEPQSLLVGLWGTWVNTITQGRVAESLAWARTPARRGKPEREHRPADTWAPRQLSSHFYLGELNEALAQRDEALALYDPERAQRWRELTGNDVRTAAGVFSSQALWMLGYPDQAAQVSDQKDADARRLGHPFDIGWALTWGAYVFDYRLRARSAAGSRPRGRPRRA